jgi:5-methylcytosine-specific restriction endonuclease McrA
MRKRCATCEKEFEVVWRSGSFKYCSRECATRQIVKICLECGEEYGVERYREGTAKFCSKKCTGKYARKNMLKAAFDQTGKSPPNKKFKDRFERGLYWANKATSTVQGKLHVRFRTAVITSLKNRARRGSKESWRDAVGYSTSELKKHLERRFLPGMTWDNYGRGGWHIDHIIPVSAFNFTSVDDIDFKRCWALKNLRPLWEHDNLSKGARLERPFQPALPM